MTNILYSSQSELSIDWNGVISGCNCENKNQGAKKQYKTCFYVGKNIHKCMFILCIYTQITHTPLLDKSKTNDTNYQEAINRSIRNQKGLLHTPIYTVWLLKHANVLFIQIVKLSQ